MPVIQHYTNSSLRNFSYIIYCAKTKLAMVVDPFEGKSIERLIKTYNLSPTAIINTHEHWDHIGGNDYLKKKFGLEVIYSRSYLNAFDGITRGVDHEEEIKLGEEYYLRFLSTPGHTESHLSIVLLDTAKTPSAVFSGDTFFNAGVGNCKNGGDPKVLFKTISKYYDSLSDDLIIYPGHDYLKNNLEFTLSLEENSSARSMLSQCRGEEYNKSPLKMLDERKVNLFLKEGRQRLQKSDDFSQNTNEQIFLKLRSLRDNW